MRRLACEMCGGTDLTKQDGVFVCQFCGAKYSVEEAKKLMVAGTVEVKGTIKVDNSDELKKLYQAARNARKTSDDATALKHYENISAKDPDSWEALFYLVILKTKSIKNSEITSSAVAVTNSLDRVFTLIKETVADENDRKEHVKEVIDQCYETATWLSNASENFYKTSTKGTGLVALTGIIGAISSLGSLGNALSENSTRFAIIGWIMNQCGNEIELKFGLEDSDYKKYATWSWKKMIDFDTTYKEAHKSHIYNDATLEACINKIKQNDPTYSVELKPAKHIPRNSEKPEQQQKTGNFSQAHVLGISGTLFVVSFILQGGYSLLILAHISSIFGIIVGLKEKRKFGKSTGLTISVISEVCAVVSSLIGIMSMIWC